MVERAFDWGYGSSLSTRYSHSLRLLASFVEPRILKRYSLGAALAPPRSPTRSLIGPQQRESRLSRLDVTEAAAVLDPNFPSISRRSALSAPAFQRRGKTFWPSASSPTWAPDPSFQLDAHDPGRVTRTRQAALPSPGNTTPRRPRVSDYRGQPHCIMGNVVQEFILCAIACPPPPSLPASGAECQSPRGK